MKTKQCKRCKQDLSLDDFYSHPQTKDRKSAKCKRCQKEMVKSNYAKNRQYYVDYDKKRQRTLERRQKKKEYQDRRRKKYPEKYKANTAVGNAIRDGRLIKKSTCSICKPTKNIEAHHYDYSKPLDVEWLCLKCHREQRHR